MKSFDLKSKRNTTGIIFVVAALILLVTGLVAQADDFNNPPRDTSNQAVYDSQFLGGLWAAHDGPDSRSRNFFPFYYESGEKGSYTWSSPVLFSGGRTKADGSEEVRLLGGLIHHSIDRGGR